MHSCIYVVFLMCLCMYGLVTGCVHAACVLACACAAIPTVIIVCSFMILLMVNLVTLECKIQKL